MAKVKKSKTQVHTYRSANGCTIHLQSNQPASSIKKYDKNTRKRESFTLLKKK